jgi:hypothetical protein
MMISINVVASRPRFGCYSPLPTGAYCDDSKRIAACFWQEVCLLLPGQALCT